MRLFLSIIIGAQAGWAAAQTDATDPLLDPNTPIPDTASVIDEAPIASPRAAAMGGAIGTVADDLDAAFHNPAGIGGLNQAKGKLPLIRKLYFPWLTAGANQNSSKLNSELRKGGASGDAAIGKAIFDAHGGERQYGRANMVSGMVFGRSMLVPFSDLQITSTARGQGTDIIDTHYRSMTGAGFGFSAQDPEGRISIGYFGYTASRSETTTAFLYDDVIDKDRRSQAIKDGTKTYSGVGHNTGMIWRMGKSGSPTLGLNLTNAGNTKFKGPDGELEVKQDFGVAFSLSPKVGKSGAFTFILEADRLSDEDVALIKKYKAGMELSLGGIGSYGTFALRAGGNYAGPSAGLAFHLGLIGLEASAYCTDIGVGNEKIIERRGLATFYVNVAEF